ncbi:hypothetical protein EMCRGX_G002302 [Ephydatia muelleri]
MKTTQILLVFVSFVITVSRSLRVAVIVLQQPSACSYAISIVEGNNVTMCASILYLRGDVSPANISILMNTSDGSALSPKDYRAVSETRIFPAGSIEGQSVCVNITTIDDSTVEYTEFFQVTLSASDPNVTIGDRAGGAYLTVFMTDNDGEIILYKLAVKCISASREEKEGLFNA